MATTADVAPIYSGSRAINDRIANDLQPYSVQYQLSDSQINAAKHAVASALYADVYGSQAAAFFGEAFEIINFSGGGDGDRDRVNNFLGREIQAAFPGLSAEEYYNLIANMASKGLLWTPAKLWQGVTLEQTQEAMKKIAFERIRKEGLAENYTIDPNFDTGAGGGGGGGGQCFLADTPIDMWDGSKKPIQDIRPDDWVKSYDKNGKLVPGRVTRTMENRAKFILDFHGVMVTPGHAFYCAEGKFKGQHVPIIDILRDDGAIQKADGAVVRAATNCPVGSLEDQFVWVLAGPTKNGVITVTDKAQLRLGTKSLRLDGIGVSLLDALVEIHGEIDDHGFTTTGENILQSVCHWPLGKKLPNPEDYVLVRSQLTLNDIYAQGEWDAAHPPQMLTPYAGEAGGSFKQNTVLQASAPPNIPHSMQNSPNQPKMTRKQRRAHEAKLRKAGKTARRVTVH